MLLDIFLLFCISVCGVTSQFSTVAYATTTTTTTRPTTTTVAAHLSLTAEASPDYPVAAGQTVILSCHANMPSVTWYWENWKWQTWQTVGNMTNLILTKPNQSGRYRCTSWGTSPIELSNDLTVYIVNMQSTVCEKAAVAAIVLAVLALIMATTVLIWWGWQRYGGTMTTTNTALEGFPEPGKVPKGDFPQTGSDGDVYINYTSTNQAYTNLDPTNMMTDNIYSSLS